MKKRQRSAFFGHVSAIECLEGRRLLSANMNIPRAINGSATVKAGESVSGGVLGIDADGDTLTFVVTTTPRPGTGTVVLNANGNFTFTADGMDANGNKFIGPTDFTVSATDGEFFSDPATVTVTVIGDNLPPVAIGANISVQAVGAVSGQLTGSDPEGAPLTFMLAAAPAPGTGSVFLNHEGWFVFLPDVSGFTGPTTFTYTVSDGKLVSPPATVTVTVGTVVVPPNVGIPIADNSSVSVIAGQSVSGQVTASDPEGQPLTFTLASAPRIGTGTVLFNSNGSFTYTADVPGFSGPTTFTFTASDGGGLTSVPATVTVTVGSVVPPTVNVPTIALSGVPGVVFAKPSSKRNPASALAPTAKLANVPLGAIFTTATVMADFTAGAVKGDTFKMLLGSDGTVKISSSSIKMNGKTVGKIKLTNMSVSDAVTGKKVNVKKMTITFTQGTEDLVNRALAAITASNTKRVNSTRAVTFMVTGKNADQTMFSASGTMTAVSQ